jgi:acetyl esterase
MPLHPQAQAIISGVESMGLPPFETLSVEEQRGFIQNFSMFMIPKEEVASIEDVEIPGPEDAIPVRIYLPAGAEGPHPAVMYFHGGGYSAGSVELVDPICRALANRSSSAVVSVDYRLAPEHPYPAAVMDAYVATAWIAAYGPNLNIDSSRLAVVGDSSGATLATVTCMLFRDKADDISVDVQMLLCPVTDMVKFETPSYKEYGDGGYLLTTGMMEKFRDYYLTGVEDRVDEPYCSPVRTQNLQDLPPAIIIIAECDPLRDEAIAYGELMRANGNLVEIRQEEGMLHNFFWMGAAIDRGREIIDEIGADLRAVLHAPR